jgi:hypothetical protein
MKTHFLILLSLLFKKLLGDYVSPSPLNEEKTDAQVERSVLLDGAMFETLQPIVNPNKVHKRAVTIDLQDTMKLVWAGGT